MAGKTTPAGTEVKRGPDAVARPYSPCSRNACRLNFVGPRQKNTTKPRLKTLIVPTVSANVLGVGPGRQNATYEGRSSQSEHGDRSHAHDP